MVELSRVAGFTEKTAQIEAVFRRIQQERMADVPVINPKLAVQWVGGSAWNNGWLGILITPWFMNVLWLPNEASEPPPQVGEVRVFTFPSGQYDFVAGHEPLLGHYFSCSLFSPMFEFENQAAAEATAVEALLAMLDPANCDESSRSQAEEIAQIWRGEKPRPPGTFGADIADDDGGGELVARLPGKTLSERLAEPVSRRDFLRGKVFSEEPSAGRTPPQQGGDE
ncbi:MAG: [NiFe]-hydrogenase assembly chaperone HybE [Thiotrichales bacterium]